MKQKANKLDYPMWMIKNGHPRPGYEYKQQYSSFRQRYKRKESEFRINKLSKEVTNSA